MEHFFELIGLKVSEVFAGLLGGMAAFFILPKEQISPFRALSYMFIGAVCSGYFTGFALQYLGWGLQFSGAMSFVIGALGIYLMKYIISFAEDPLSLINQFRNGPKSKK